MTSGFEFIPTFLIMTTLPVFYYFLAQGQKIKKALISFLIISGGALCGTMATMLVQVERLEKIEGSKEAGWNYIVKSFFRRTTGQGMRDEMPLRIQKVMMHQSGR